MTKFVPLLALAATASAAAFALTSQHLRAAAAPRRSAQPTVLELFQSQGCSSCPPALKVLVREADRKDVIALNFAVTYWDQLGWKDLFAKPAFTKRQWDYAHFNGRSEVATPQLIVNGREFVNGSDQGEVDRAIAEFAPGEVGPIVKRDGEELEIGAAHSTRTATIWLVSYDPRVLNVPIRAGENEGRTLPHRNIVRDLIALGSWRGSAERLKLPPTDRMLRRAVLVQAGTGGPIIAAYSLN